MIRAASSAMGCCLFITCIAAASGPPRIPRGDPAHVGVVLDGQSTFTDGVRRAFEREIASYFGDERVVDFPERHALAADWTRQGAAAAIEQLLARKDVDIVVALGPVGSNVLAHRRSLPKPAIAALVVDASLQHLSFQNGAT